MGIFNSVLESLKDKKGNLPDDSIFILEKLATQFRGHILVQIETSKKLGGEFTYSQFTHLVKKVYQEFLAISRSQNNNLTQKHWAYLYVNVVIPIRNKFYGDIVLLPNVNPRSGIIGSRKGDL